jgi:hypothetical protein
MINKKIILKVFAISTFVVLVMAAYIYANVNRDGVTSTSSLAKSGFAEILNKNNSTVSPSSPSPSPENTLPPYVGENHPTPVPVDQHTTQFFTLVNKTPFSLGFANVDMDYANNKFTVALVAPYVESKTNFMTWLKDNGFSLITESDIEFSEK